MAECVCEQRSAHGMAELAAIFTAAQKAGLAGRSGNRPRQDREE
jgi:hypothetical protein